MVYKKLYVRGGVVNEQLQLLEQLF